MNVANRILQETRELAKNPPMGITATPKGDNMRYFDVTIQGPKDTPYEGGVFRLELFLSESYPLVAPNVRFLTKIYHPNIDKIGRICLDILTKTWTPALKIETTLLSIQALLDEPNPDDGLDTAVTKHWETDPAGAREKAKEWTRLYAHP